MARLTSFTDEELRILRELIRDRKNSIHNNYLNRLGADEYDDEHQAPETYVALVPVGGIPAATPAMGTGALDFTSGDLPGVALCDIYQPVGNPPELQFIRKQQLVLNLSATAITQQWITVTREKFGRWIAQVGGSGGGSDCTPRNEIWMIALIGDPLGGTFDITFPIGATSDTVTIDYDSAAAEAKTAIEAHSELVSGDINAEGGPLPDASLKIEFQGDQANTPITLTSFDKSGLSGTPGTGTTGDTEGIGVVVFRWQPGFAGN